MNAGLDILNVGKGDMKLVFDNPEDLAKAKEMIPDLLRRGYALLIEVGGQWQRIHSFDAEKGLYYVSTPIPASTIKEIKADPPPEPEPEPVVESPRRGRPRRAVPMDSARATAIAPSAGG